MALFYFGGWIKPNRVKSHTLPTVDEPKYYGIEDIYEAPPVRILTNKE
jgi:hypothetical protein